MLILFYCKLIYIQYIKVQNKYKVNFGDNNMKNIAAFLFVVFFSFSVQAKVNLFAYSRPAPDTEIYYQDGTKHKLSEYKGDFVIALFWSKKCVPCVRELKSLDKFYKKTKGMGIKVVMISPKNEWETNLAQSEFLKKYKADNIDFYTDENGDLAADFGIFSYPHSVLINQDGEEIGRIRGQMNWDSDKVLKYILDLRDGKYDVKK